MSELEKKLKHKAKFLQEQETKIEFYRTAADAAFAEVFYEAIDGKSARSKWLIEIEYETDDNYTRRAKTAKDLGWSKKVIDNYKGYFMNAKINIGFDGPEDLTEKLKNNIDGNGTNYEQFIEDVINELLVIATTNIITDSPPEGDGLPYSYIIHEEQVLDYANDPLIPGFAFFRFASHDSIIQGIDRIPVSLYYAFTPEVIIIGKEIEKKQFTAEEFPNNIGYVPIIRSVVSEGVPIIAPIATLQLDQMNLLSELREIIRKQAINILAMPKSAFENMGILRTDSVLVYPNDYAGPPPFFVAYPASGLQAHFDYNKLLIDSVYDLSNLKRKNQNAAESGVSKVMDFLDVRSVLNMLADEIEMISEQIATDWSNISNKTVKSNVSINRDTFDLKGLEEVLNGLVLAMTVGYGEEAEKELLKNSVDTVFAGSTDEKKQEILDELESRVNPADNLIIGEFNEPERNSSDN